MKTENSIRTIQNAPRVLFSKTEAFLAVFAFMARGMRRCEFRLPPRVLAGDPWVEIFYATDIMDPLPGAAGDDEIGRGSIFSHLLTLATANLERFRAKPLRARRGANTSRGPISVGLKVGRFDKSYRKSLAFCLLPFAFCIAVASATELATSFVDVVVLDVPLGTPRRVQDRLGKSLVLMNNGDNTVYMHVQALVPAKAELKGPVLAIPDLQWIHIEPATVEVPAHGEAEAQVIILVPSDKQYADQLYQVMIWSRSQSFGSEGVTISAGLKSRLRFKTIRMGKGRP